MTITKDYMHNDNFNYMIFFNDSKIQSFRNGERTNSNQGWTEVLEKNECGY